jgi:hypothetical protein
MADTTKKTYSPKAKKPVAAKAAPVAPTIIRSYSAPAATPAPAPVAVAAAPAAKPQAAKTITSEERKRRIEQAAYYLAEKRGFQGDAQEDWIAAEAQIDAQLAKERVKVAG